MSEVIMCWSQYTSWWLWNIITNGNSYCHWTIDAPTYNIYAYVFILISQQYWNAGFIIPILQKWVLRAEEIKWLG